MKNQPSAGEQLILLQNISYVKQFMQRGSLKVLFLVNLLLTITIGLFINSFKGICNTFLDFLMDNYDFNITVPAEDTMNSLISTSTISTIVFGLVLPITLLYIIIRSRSDNPSVVPSGAVKFLYVLSFIQTIFVVIGSIVMLVLQFFSIFAADSIVEAIISFAIYFICELIVVIYYILQTKFLGAIKHSCTGFSLIYGSSKGFGVLSVLASICSGVFSAISIVIFIVCNSIFSSADLESNPNFDSFIAMGGKEVFDALKPAAIIFIVITILYTLYNILLAVVTFAYRDIVTEAINESFVSTKRTNTNINSAFRTYGGSNSYSNYNYTSSNVKGQQSYAVQDNNNNNNNTNKENTTVKKEVISETPVDTTFNPYNEPQDSFNNTYNEPVSTNGSFIPNQQEFQNNNINQEPVNINGSFGFQQDFNDNYQ